MTQQFQKGRESSPLEDCGFVLHFITLPLVLVYIVWIVMPEQTLEEWEITYFPPKSWSFYIPTFLACGFVSVLFLNGAMNLLITPRVDSIYTMWDEHSRPCTQRNDINGEGLPEICDLNVSIFNDLVFTRNRDTLKQRNT